MRGGGYGTGEHGTLADRVAAPAATPALPRRTPSTPARHCFVAGEPALLVQWARTDRGWEGRVVSMVWWDDVGWAMVERWLPAASIDAAHGDDVD